MRSLRSVCGSQRAGQLKDIKDQPLDGIEVNRKTLKTDRHIHKGEPSDTKSANEPFNDLTCLESSKVIMGFYLRVAQQHESISVSHSVAYSLSKNSVVVFIILCY